MAIETYFPCIYTIKKVREEKGKVGVVIRAWPHIREKYPNNSGMMYLLFNGKRRNLAHCLLRYRSLWARKHSKQLVKYPHVLYFKPAKTVYLCIL